MVVSLFVRTRALETSFWIDEALSVAIASHPLLEIPGLLRQDGSPPLYYVLLHLWMRLTGTGEAETHAFSALFAVASVPATYWAATSVLSRRGSWIAASLAALVPFLTAYGQETRMYSVVALLSVLATGAFLRAFVLGRRRFLAVFALFLALLLYTHNWGLFFAAGAGAVLLFLAREGPDRSARLRDGALAFGGAALLYLPWVPTLVYQATHTGAPWSRTPSPAGLLAGPVALVSSDSAAMALLLAGGAGLATLFRHAGPIERRGVLAAGILAVATLLLAWISSQIAPAWANRYLAVLLGPLFLVAGAGLARAGRLGLVALALVLLPWLTHTLPANKSNVEEVAAQIAPTVAPGDLVVSTQPDQVPVLHYYFPPGLRYATPMGSVYDPRLMDWRDALERMRDARVETSLAPLLDELPVGAHVVLVRPIFRNPSDRAAPWLAVIRHKSVEWGRTLGRDDRFRRLDAVPRSLDRVAVNEVRAVVYVKSAATATRGERG